MKLERTSHEIRVALFTSFYLSEIRAVFRGMNPLEKVFFPKTTHSTDTFERGQINQNLFFSSGFRNYITKCGRYFQNFSKRCIFAEKPIIPYSLEPIYNNKLQNSLKMEIIIELRVRNKGKVRDLGFLFILQA